MSPKALIAHSVFFSLFASLAFFGFSTPAYASCGFGDLVCGIMSGAGKLFATFIFVVVQIFGVLLGWISAFFNTAAIVTVFQFSNYFGNSEGLLLAWGILRDLANIVILFGFVFIGIGTILNIGNFSAKKALPSLLIFAVLLNFSLFATEAVIDASNAIGSSFFAQAGGVDCTLSASITQCSGQGIAGHLLSAVGISSIFDPDSWGDGIGEIMNADDGIAAAVLYLGILILIIVMCAIMFAGAIILITRAITLMLLMVTSPLGFAGMAIPGLQKLGKKWWDTLLQNVIFAPIFVLLILVGLKVAEGIRTGLVGNSFSITEKLSGSDPVGIGTVFVMFALVIGLFWGALMFAKQSGIIGASAVASGAMKWAGNTAGSFTTTPIGMGARALEKGYGGAARAVRRATPSFARPVLAALGGNAIDSGIRGALGSAQKVTIPGTGMDTYETSRKRREDRFKGMNEGDSLDKKKERLNKALESGNKDDIKAAVSSMSVSQLKEGGYLDDDKKSKTIATALGAPKFKELMEDTTISSGIKDRMKKERYDTLETAADAAVRDARAGNFDTIEKFMKDTDVIDLKEMKHLKDSGRGAELELMAGAMSSTKFKQFNEDKEVDSVTKKRFRDARYEGPRGLKKRIRDAADTTRSPAEVAAAIEDVSKWSAEEFETSGALSDPTLREQVARVISDDQYKALQASSSIGTSTKTTLEGLREDPTKDGSRFHARHIDHTFNKIITRPSERAKLPGNILASLQVRSRLKPADFVAVQKAGRLEEGDRQLLATRVQALVRVNDPVMLAQIGRLKGRELARFKDFYNLP